MTKKKRKYFVGGAVNTGLSSAGQAVGLNQGASNYLGNVGQLAAGAATGNPQDIIGGATGLLTSGWGTAIDTFKNKDASVGQKALAAYGAINPMASIFSSGITDKLAQQKADEDEFNSLIKNRMANGGNIPRQTTNEFQEYSNQPMQPMVPRQANVPVQQPEFNYIPYRQDVSMSPMVSNNTLLDASNMPTPEADLRVRGLRENLYNNMMTNEYDGVPRSIPRGQRINPELVMAARNEDARNQAIKNYMDSSLWTQQKTNGDLQSIMTDPAFGQIQKLPDQKKDGGPLVEFNGNSHEDGGIAITLQDEVEGGETMLNNYIFSDTLKVDKELLKGTGLPDNLSGKTFAAASKLLSKELEDRPDDEITKETTDIFLNNLMNMNEVSRINKEQVETNELKCGGVKKHQNGDYINKINPYMIDNSVLPNNPILADIEAANALQQSNTIQDNSQVTTQQPQQPNRWSVDNIFEYATTPEEKQMALENFSRRDVGDWRRDANAQGFELGSDGIPKQSVQGRFAGGVTPEHLRMLYPELANQVAPDGSNEWSDEQINQFQAAYQEANKGQNMELNPDNPTSNIIGGDWLRGSDMQRRPDVSIPEIPGGTIQTDTVDLGREVNSDLMPVPDKQYSIEDNPPPERGPMDMSWLRFAPVANALIPPPELEQYNPSIISAGYLKPDLQRMSSLRASMDAAQRGNIGALANVSGGSGAAQRAGLLGSGANYAGAVGNAFMQANQFNNQATQQANQFNIGTQANIAGQNQQALNQAGLFNTQNQNRWNEEKRKLWSEGLESLGNIGQEEWAKGMYDTSSLMTTGATGPGGFVPTKPKYGGVKTKIGKSGMTSEFL